MLRLALFLALLSASMTLGAGCDKQANAEEKASKKESKRDRDRDRDRGDEGDDTVAAAQGVDEGGRPRFRAGRLNKKEIPESSGVVASRKHPGVFWTINDSGNGPTLFAFERDGKLLGEFPVNVRNNDWEAITTDDEGRLYVGDIGNNDRNRDRVIVYRFDEPDPTAKRARSAPPLRASGMWRLKFPDKPFDAESLFVHQGRGYLISKLLNARSAGVYSFDLSPQTDAATLKHECDLPVRPPVTDAALSPDGERLAVMTVTGPYLFSGLKGDVAAAAKGTPTKVTYFDPGDLNMEGVCFVEGGLLATTEEGQILFFADQHFK